MKHLFINRQLDAGTTQGGGDVFQSWMTFIQNIGANFTKIGTDLNTIVGGLNPSGMSAAEVEQLGSALSNLSTQATSAGAQADAAAAAAGAGQTAPPAGGNTGSTN